MTDVDNLKRLMQDLTGEEPPIPSADLAGACRLLRGGRGLGWSQLNEVLLLLGYDRVDAALFQYLVDRSTEYQPGASLASFKHLARAVEEFRVLALLIFGNVKFAFKTFSRHADVLRGWLDGLTPVKLAQFSRRHAPVLPIRRITADRAYLCGYMIEAQINEKLAADPEDHEALTMRSEREAALADALVNHHAYLASDHLDVYVATSMRQRHEFLLVNRLTSGIFEHEALRGLNLRWFDPTQASCPDRIDKGLAEALMLKRAKCTLYLAQESETLGKDSELASTLAQGKPVIAFVPRGDAEYVEKLVDDLRKANPSKSEVELLLEQLRVFNSGLAWTDPVVQGWVGNPELAPLGRVRARFASEVRQYYEKRAKTLKETHPLGIQVYLASGVANGVLVARTVTECAKLVRRIVTRRLQFRLRDYFLGDKRYSVLEEKISGCVFRVVTGDEMLTNAFWNFYLLPEG